MARTGLRMMPTSPSSPLKFRTAGFPRYGFKAGLSGGACPRGVHVSRRLVCVHPSCPPLANRESPFCAGEVARMSTAVRAFTALPQGPSLRSRLCCPGPSSLIRPHPSPSQAHRDFTTWWLIRVALAVPFGLGDPRAVPCFHCSFLLGMPSSPTPGTSPATFTQLRRRRHWPSPLWNRLGAPKHSHHPFQVGASISGLHWFALATACRVASLLDGSDRVSPATETFTSGLSTCRSPFTLPDIATVALGCTPPAGLSPAGTAASIAALQSRKP